MERFLCMRLPTAGVVIGWVGGIFSFIGVIICGLLIGYPEFVVKQMQEQDPDIKVTETSIIIIASISLTFVLINLLASALLVIGTIQERHLMLLPWLVNWGASLIFELIYNIAFFFSIIQGAPFHVMILGILLNAAVLSFKFLIWYAIYSLFKQLQSGRERQHLLGAGVNTTPRYTKI